jgi:hypothetical protein
MFYAAPTGMGLDFFAFESGRERERELNYRITIFFDGNELQKG